jgi:putative transposase
MRGRTFSREFKLDVCRQSASGEKRVAQVCREHQLGETVLLRWRKEYESRGEAAFTRKGPEAGAASSLEQRVVELERLCGQLALENAVLKRGLRSTPSRSGTP